VSIFLRCGGQIFDQSEYHMDQIGKVSFFWKVRFDEDGCLGN
jgi:hypothetical protein